MSRISYEFLNKNGVIQRFDLMNLQDMGCDSLEGLIEIIKSKLTQDGITRHFYPRDVIELFGSKEKYSENEKILFHHFGFDDLLSIDSIEPLDVYKTVSLHVFKNKKAYYNPNAIESLKRGLNHFDLIVSSSSFRRGTKEFENLIKF